MAKTKNLSGLRFGSLFVTSFAGNARNSAGISVRRWMCTCDCGNTTTVSTQALTSGNTKSCGCKIISKCRKHGLSESRQHQIWTDMKQRCSNPSNASYHRYGGRGISYDPKWENFEAFWEDMQEGYADNLTIERTDVSGNYNKNNCKWTTMLYQGHNRRMSCSNTSGVTGVRFYIDKRGSTYIVASAMFEGKIRERHFSVKKFGLLPAFAMACACREKMIQKLNEQGAGYSDKHGK